jgi:hypothetical protein
VACAGNFTGTASETVELGQFNPAAGGSEIRNDLDLPNRRHATLPPFGACG